MSFLFFFVFNPSPSPSSYLGVCFTCEHSVFLLAPVFLSDERVGRFQRATQRVWRNFSTYTFIWRRRPLICRLPPNVCKQTGPPHLLSSERREPKGPGVCLLDKMGARLSVSTHPPPCTGPAYMRCTCARVHACTHAMHANPRVSREHSGTLLHVNYGHKL